MVIDRDNSAHRVTPLKAALENGEKGSKESEPVVSTYEEVEEPAKKTKGLKKVFTKGKNILWTYASFIGPGIMVAVAYMDPGNYATGTTAGASQKYSLLFFVLLSNIIAIFLQVLCIKLGTVSGYDLARCSREYFPRWVNIILWFLAECAIIATDIAEVIGSAIALNVLLKIPLPAGVCITIVDVVIILIAYRTDTSSMRFVKMFEYVVAVLVLGVTICFAVELSKIKVDSVRELFRGFAPLSEMVEGSGLTTATSILGATVMIHSLFLGTGIVQPRLREFDYKQGNIKLMDVIGDEDVGMFNEKTEKKQLEIVKKRQADYFYNKYKPSYAAVTYSLKYSIAELVVMLFSFALFVNLAILIVAGASMYGTPEAMDADLYTIYNILSRTMSPSVGTVFMVALLFSGQSSAIVCTIAGQIVSEGHINWSLRPWLRRIVTRSISIVPCFIISMCIGKGGLNKALNASQVVISLLLPPLTGPLIYFTSKKSVMNLEIPRNESTDQSPTDRNDTENPERSSHDGSDSGDCEDGRKYRYMGNNWFTMIVAVLVWLFISALNIYSIYDMAKNGMSG